MDLPAAEQQSEEPKDQSAQDEGYCTKLDIEEDGIPAQSSVPPTNRLSTNRSTNCTEDVVVRSDDDEVRSYVEEALKVRFQKLKAPI